MLIMEKIFPRFDDELGKCMLNFFFFLQIYSFIGNMMGFNLNIRDFTTF